MRSVVLIVMMGLGVSACTDSSGDEPGVRAAVQALCDARDGLAESADASRRVFEDEVHAGMHALARKVIPRDRTAGAEVLEAKQRLEAAFDTDSATGVLERFETQLIRAANSALVAIDMAPVRCP